MAVEARLNIALSLIIVRDNAHEVEAMRNRARELDVGFREYASISPTIHSTAEPLPSQAPQYLTNRAPFTSCPAGVTFFHADPFGRPSICKVGRDPNIDSSPASGPVCDVGILNTGRNSAIAARVRTTDHTLFVKGLPLDHPWVWTQKRE
jgi:hypothetical protein